MADDDFDIDIYGDANPEQDGPFRKDSEGDVNIVGLDGAAEETSSNNLKSEEEEDHAHVDVQAEVDDQEPIEEHQQIKSTDESSQNLITIPKQAPQKQGMKRKEGSDDRLVDPGATTALLISDLHWWNTDDDIRGWINQAQCEDELKEITFSEHKVNGKSKG